MRLLPACRRCRWVSMGAERPLLVATGSGATRASISGPYNKDQKSRPLRASRRGDPPEASLREARQARQAEATPGILGAHTAQVLRSRRPIREFRLSMRPEA